MRKIWTAFLIMLPCLFAQGGERCQEVGGAILTNSIPESGTIALVGPNGEPGTTTENFVAVILGTATGDLRGGVVIFVLPPTSTMPIRVHGNWVTESGDTIYADEANATPGSPIPGSNVSAAFYPGGLNITGGTGRFAGAHGNLNILFGAGDSVSGQFIYRYQGTICFAQSQN
jgi:hypothetical protein